MYINYTRTFNKVNKATFLLSMGVAILFGLVLIFLGDNKNEDSYVETSKQYESDKYLVVNERVAKHHNKDEILFQIESALTNQTRSEQGVK